MINSNIIISNSSTSAVKAKVELYNGSTLVKTCTCSDDLQGFSLSRVGDNTKFFGFGVCQKLNTNLIDLMREMTITTDNTIEIGYVVDNNEEHPHPTFYVEEVSRDEDTNTLTVTAYDALNKASKHTISEVGLTAPYTIRDVAGAIATFLGLDWETFFEENSDGCFDTYYENGANLDGTEGIREVLDDIAEATQTIYYINNYNSLVFKRVNIWGGGVLTISKDDYFSMHTQTERKLTAICSVTELGDNVEAETQEVITESTTGEAGSTQYIRDNPFWNLREDIGALVDDAMAAMEGLTISQFDCEWAGNFLVEIGDMIELETENGGLIFSYLLNDTITFDGTLGQFTEWAYEDNEGETASNPTNLGELMNRTYAKVDKANKQIDIVAGETRANGAAVSALQINTESISASVTSLEKGTSATNENIEVLSEQVSRLELSAEQLSLSFTNIEDNGVTKVDTGTGFVFDETGLTVSKAKAPTTTKITENGMTIDRGGDEVLVADSEGVRAEDLHATTYLIIGNNSRFEDWTDENGTSRTACFWIGG